VYAPVGVGTPTAHAELSPEDPIPGESAKNPRAGGQMSRAR